MSGWKPKDRSRAGKVLRFRRGARQTRRWHVATPPSGYRRPRMRNKLSDPRFYLKAVVGLAGLGLIVLPLGSDALGALIGPGHAGGCRVVSVTDGDTVRLHCPGRGLEKTRLLGFDTPEVFSPQCASEFLRGIRATWALRALLFRADKMGVVREGTDKYDRALVFMSLDGVPLARRMIEAGHARAYDGGRRGGWCLGAMP